MASKKSKKHTAEDLKELDLKALQKICKDLGIAYAGKRPAELIKSILAVEGGATAKGRKKATTKKAGKGKSSKDDDDDEDDEDSDDEDSDEDDDSDDEDDSDDSDEDSDEDSDDEDDDEDEKPAKGKASVEARLTALEKIVFKSTAASKPAKGKKAKDEDEDGDDDEDSDDGDEDGDDDAALRISLKDVAKADLDELKEIAEKINEHEGSVVIKYKKVSKASVLKDAIRDYMNEHADKEEAEDEEGDEDGDDESDDDDDSSGKAPAWLKPKAKVKAKYEKKWYDAVVRKVNKKDALVFFPADKTELEVEFKDLKKA